MPRPLRPVGEGLIFHALNRGNNRQDVFFDADDRRMFLDALAAARERYPFLLYGYCLMTNHFHLELEPIDGQSISRILQSITVAHTWRYHRRRGGVGHVWQGRFKSPVIEGGAPALVVLRYIESNPLRARIVRRLEDYPHEWSSYAHHALGEGNPLLSEPPGWRGLGNTEAQRRRAWARLCHAPLDEPTRARVAARLTSGRPFGGERFVAKMAKRLGLRLAPRKRGRPRKQKI